MLGLSTCLIQARPDSIAALQVQVSPADVKEQPTFALPISKPAKAPQKAQSDKAAQPSSPSGAKPQSKAKQPQSSAAQPNSPQAPLSTSHSRP